MEDKNAGAPRRGGRRKNKWTLVSLKQMLGFIAVQEITQKTFASHVGVTNSTFHNWKNGRCAPEEEVQVKIRALINGKETINVTEETTKPRKGRGSASSTLAALTGSLGKVTKKVAKKKTAKKKPTKAKTNALVEQAASKPAKKAKKAAKKKVAKKAAKKTKVAKKAVKKVGRVVYAKIAEPSSNGNGFSLHGWENLETLGQFVKANGDRSIEEISHLVGTLKTAAKILG